MFIRREESEAQRRIAKHREEVSVMYVSEVLVCNGSPNRGPKGLLSQGFTVTTVTDLQHTHPIETEGCCNTRDLSSPPVDSCTSLEGPFGGCRLGGMAANGPSAKSPTECCALFHIVSVRLRLDKNLGD